MGGAMLETPFNVEIVRYVAPIQRFDRLAARQMPKYEEIYQGC